MRRQRRVGTQQHPAELRLCPLPESHRGRFKDSCCFVVTPLCFLVFSSFSLSSPEGRWEVAEVQPFTRLALKDSETLPLLSQPLYGGLMIYCSDFSLFSSYLEGGQFNKHARFLPPAFR